MMNLQFYNKFFLFGLFFIGLFSACQDTEQQAKEEQALTLLCRDSTLYNGMGRCCVKQLDGSKYEVRMTAKLDEKLVQYKGTIDLVNEFEFSIKELNEDGFLDVMFVNDGKYRLLLSDEETFVWQEYEEMKGDSL